MPGQVQAQVDGPGPDSTQVQVQAASQTQDRGAMQESGSPSLRSGEGFRVRFDSTLVLVALIGLIAGLIVFNSVCWPFGIKRAGRCPAQCV